MVRPLNYHLLLHIDYQLFVVYFDISAIRPILTKNHRLHYVTFNLLFDVLLLFCIAH